MAALLCLALAATAQSPEAIWKKAGCAECHRAGAEGGDILKQGPLWSKGWINAYLSQPGTLRPGSKKRPLDLPEAERETLVTYLYDAQKERRREYSKRLQVTTTGPPPRWDRDASAKLFERHCAPCHGARGKGDGPLGKFFVDEAKPRDFTKGRFRRKEPALDDIYLTLTKGMPGSGMAAFPHLTEAERWGLSRTVISLGPHPPAEKPYRAPDPPAATADLIEKGRLAFLLGGCQVCHGANRKGVSRGRFFSWTDEAGRPILRSRDLTGGVFRTGSDPRSLYRALFRGRDGTPMPSFGEVFEQEEDRWALVWFVKSLSDPELKALDGK